jgi:predicted DNA-binding transcriptional regulator AlpA
MSRRHAWPIAAETGTVDAAPAPEAAPAVERLALRLDEIAKALGVSRRALERERSAGRFPRPDRTLGRMPLWRVETVRAWLEGGGA